MIPSSAAYLPAWTAAAPPKANKRKSSRIVSSLDSRLSNQIAHMRIDNSVNAARRPGRAHTHRRRDLLFEDLQRSLLIQSHLAAEEAIFVQISKNQVSVGNRNFRAAEPIADRSRLGAGALRTDFEQPGFRIDPDNAAAARADDSTQILVRNIW